MAHPPRRNHFFFFDSALVSFDAFSASSASAFFRSAHCASGLSALAAARA